ncbi:hypothetical protein DFP73DRAFT_623009, partial [Morchella snyderi]
PTSYPTSYPIPRHLPPACIDTYPLHQRLDTYLPTFVFSARATFRLLNCSGHPFCTNHEEEKMADQTDQPTGHHDSFPGFSSDIGDTTVPGDGSNLFGDTTPLGDGSRFDIGADTDFFDLDYILDPKCDLFDLNKDLDAANSGIMNFGGMMDLSGNIDPSIKSREYDQIYDPVNDLDSANSGTLNHSDMIDSSCNIGLFDIKHSKNDQNIDLNIDQGAANSCPDSSLSMTLPTLCKRKRDEEGELTQVPLGGVGGAPSTCGPATDALFKSTVSTTGSGTHTLRLMTNGSVYSKDHNADYVVHFRFPLGRAIAQLVAGDHLSATLTEGGQLYAWGALIRNYFAPDNKGCLYPINSSSDVPANAPDIPHLLPLENLARVDEIQAAGSRLFPLANQRAYVMGHTLQSMGTRAGKERACKRKRAFLRKFLFPPCLVRRKIAKIYMLEKNTVFSDQQKTRPWRLDVMITASMGPRINAFYELQP